eukprot:Colp12_sorted_trinity150504_noHs@22575
MDQSLPIVQRKKRKIVRFADDVENHFRRLALIILISLLFTVFYLIPNIESNHPPHSVIVNADLRVTAEESTLRPGFEPIDDASITAIIHAPNFSKCSRKTLANLLKIYPTLKVKIAVEVDQDEAFQAGFDQPYVDFVPIPKGTHEAKAMSYLISRVETSFVLVLPSGYEFVGQHVSLETLLRLRERLEADVIASEIDPPVSFVHRDDTLLFVDDAKTAIYPGVPGCYGVNYIPQLYMATTQFLRENPWDCSMGPGAHADWLLDLSVLKKKVAVCGGPVLAVRGRNTTCEAEKLDFTYVMQKWGLSTVHHQDTVWSADGGGGITTSASKTWDVLPEPETQQLATLVVEAYNRLPTTYHQRVCVLSTDEGYVRRTHPGALVMFEAQLAFDLPPATYSDPPANN